MHTGLALTAISVLVIWFASGLTMMLLMAGMQSIPQELYEAAKVDGASWWDMERRHHAAAAAPVDRAQPDHLGDRLVPGLQPVLHPDRRRARHQHVDRGHVDLRAPAFAQFDVGLASAMSVVLVIVVGLISFAQFYFLQRDVTD